MRIAQRLKSWRRSPPAAKVPELSLPVSFLTHRLHSPDASRLLTPLRDLAEQLWEVRRVWQRIPGLPPPQQMTNQLGNAQRRFDSYDEHWALLTRYGVKPPRGAFERAVLGYLFFQLSAPPQQTEAQDKTELFRAIPAAVLHAVTAVRDSQGMVSASAVEARFGRDARVLFEGLHQSCPEDSFELCHSYRDGPGDSLGPPLLARMQGLSKLSQQVGSPDALVRCALSYFAHLLPTNVGLDAALVANGLEPSMCSAHGKPYSLNSRYQYHALKGGRAVHFSASGTTEADYQRRAAVELTHVFEWFDSRSEGEMSGHIQLLADDGGYLTSALLEHLEVHPEHRKYLQHFRVFEQTQHGVDRIRACLEKLGYSEPPIPIILGAEAEVKKRLESPAVAEGVVLHIERGLARLNASFEIVPKEAVVLGYGAVGRATASALRSRGYEVYVYDPSPEKTALALEDGCVAYEAQNDEERARTRREILKHGHLVLGCTQARALRLEEYDLLPDGAVLANAASARHGLGMDALDSETFEQMLDATRALNPTREDWLGFKTQAFAGRTLQLPAHELDVEGTTDDVVLRTLGHKEVLVLQGGYVVNFALGLPPEYAQIPLAVVLCGLLQARAESRPGFHALENQKVIEATLREDLEAKQLSLEQPSHFERLGSWEWIHPGQDMWRRMTQVFAYW